MKIAGTGLSGLVGSRVAQLLSHSNSFDFIGRKNGVDITNHQQVLYAVKKSEANVLLHFAAKTDVDGCEEDRELGVDGEAWKVNVLGTKNIGEACLEAKKHLVYISTDFVFDGSKDVYYEEDIPNPLSWYGRTKYEGEKIISSLQTPWTIVRIAYPYRAFFQKKDFARIIIEKMQQGEELSMITDHVMTPTFVDDIAFALDSIVREGLTGIFHVVGSQFVTPYEAAVLIAKNFNFNPALLKTTTRDIFFKGRAPRPFRLALRNDKIKKFGVHLHPFSQGLEIIKKEISL